MEKNREPLSAMQSAALEVAMGHGGRLKRLPGGFWAHERYKWQPRSRPDPFIRSTTIGALVERGLMEFVTPVLVKVKR